VAADQARLAYANEDAATQLRRALAAARKSPVANAVEQAEASMTLGDVLEQAGRFEEAIEAYREVGRLVDLPALRLTALSKRARVYDKAGHPSVALREATRGVRAADAVEDATTRHALLADLLTTRALALTGQGRYSAAHQEALRAEANARQSGSPVAVAVALNCVEETLLAMGRPSGGTYSGEALTLLQGSGNLRLEAITTGDLGMAAFYAGRWDEAAPAYERSGRVFRRIGDVVRAATADANLAEMYVLQNRASEARPLLSGAIQIFRSTGRRDMLDFAEILLARVLLAEGDVAAAHDLASEVSRRMRDVGALTSAIEADVVVAEAATASGAPDTALAVLSHAIDGSRGEWELLRPSVERARAQALAAAGRTEEAASALRRGWAAAREMDMAYEAWSLTLSLAALDDIDTADVADARRGLASLGVIDPR
jgi:tetratricopeptide (TPR) repeat protein